MENVDHFLGRVAPMDYLRKWGKHGKHQLCRFAEIFGNFKLNAFQSLPFVWSVDFEIDDKKVEWLYTECHYVVVDGQHRLQALKDLEKAGSAKLPKQGIDCRVISTLI